MYQIGIDVGSTYTKYCIMKNNNIISLFSEKTPIRQKEFFDKKIVELNRKYPNAVIVSCGYGKTNVEGLKNINELSALAKGAYYCTKKNCGVLDIGGQDTKIISQVKGNLKEFFVNNKCAAGSGIFLSTVLNLINIQFANIDLSDCNNAIKPLTSTCAVFAQSEIIELIANNIPEEEIILRVIYHILLKAKPLFYKIQTNSIYISGGLSQIKGITLLVKKILDIDCIEISNGTYVSSIGCALNAIEFIKEN